MNTVPRPIENNDKLYILRLLYHLLIMSSFVGFFSFYPSVRASEQPIFSLSLFLSLSLSPSLSSARSLIFLFLSPSPSQMRVNQRNNVFICLATI